MKIAVFGTVGAGKTSVSEALCSRLDHTLFKEPLEENPYFKDFYSDMKGFAFKMQIYMLTTRVENLYTIKETKDTIFDRTIFEDPVFVRVSNSLGIMNDTDFSVYNRFFQNVITPLIKDKLDLDAVVYLKVSTDKAIERINERGRQSEIETERSYWEKLNEQYEILYNELKDHYNFIVIDGNEDDFEKKMNIIISELNKVKK